MLELSSLVDAKSALNIKSTLGFFTSFTITDISDFSGVPCGSRLWGLCSVGFTAFGYEIKLGPALTRQNIRYEKKRIDNEVLKLNGHITQWEGRDQILDKI